MFTQASLQTSEINEIIELGFNPQAKLLWEWRLKLHELLSQKLTSDGDQADGQEYTRSLEVQSEAEVYLQAYAAILADRREMLMAERTLLATHDAKEKKERKTKIAMAAELDDMPIALVQSEGGEPLNATPEHEVLLKNLNDERKKLLLGKDDNPHRAVRTIMIGKFTV
jgi:E3 ubiquitin-protein ligase SHPRH